MRSIISILLFGLFSSTLISCHESETINVKPQLDSIYQSLTNDYLEGIREYGKYKSANIYNDLEFEFFMAKVSFYANNDLRSELTSTFRYPISFMNYRAGETIEVNNEKEFLKNYDVIMRDRLKLLQEQLQYSFIIPAEKGGDKNDKRVMSGENWYIYYERSKERGKEIYEIKGIW